MAGSCHGAISRESVYELILSIGSAYCKKRAMLSDVFHNVPVLVACLKDYIKLIRSLFTATA